MSGRKPDEAAARVVVTHTERFVVSTADGGFTVEADGRRDVRARPTGDGWHIDGLPDPRRLLLRRVRSGGGFTLVDGDEAEVARTMPLVGAVLDTDSRYVLLADGRLFRIVRRGPREGGFDLLGWETSGAYLTVLPEPSGWRIVPQPASGGLAEIETLSILLAAEALEAEQGPRAEST